MGPDGFGDDGNTHRAGPGGLKDEGYVESMAPGGFGDEGEVHYAGHGGLVKECVRWVVVLPSGRIIS